MKPWKAKVLAAAFLMFVALWVAGTVRGVEVPFPEPSSWDFISSAPSDRYSSRQVANNFVQIGIADTPLPKALDDAAEKIQIFEKRAALGSRSANFELDEANLRKQLAAHKAVIFYEKFEGTAPKRKLYVEINVPTSEFDAFVARLQTIGHLQVNSVQQRDRTGEFRKLTSQRRTQQSYLDALLKLRGASKMPLEDALRLEQKIVDIEKELQTLGVQMGDLAGKESYFHVDLTMVEFQPGGALDPTFSWPRRIIHGFTWAIIWWFVVAAATAVVGSCGISVWVLWPRR